MWLPSATPTTWTSSSLASVSMIASVVIWAPVSNGPSVASSTSTRSPNVFDPRRPGRQRQRRLARPDFRFECRQELRVASDQPVAVARGEPGRPERDPWPGRPEHERLRIEQIDEPPLSTPQREVGETRFDRDTGRRGLEATDRDQRHVGQHHRGAAGVRRRVRRLVGLQRPEPAGQRPSGRTPGCSGRRVVRREAQWSGVIGEERHRRVSQIARQDLLGPFDRVVGHQRGVGDGEDVGAPLRPHGVDRLARVGRNERVHGQLGEARQGRVVARSDDDLTRLRAREVLDGGEPSALVAVTRRRRRSSRSSGTGPAAGDDHAHPGHALAHHRLELAALEVSGERPHVFAPVDHAQRPRDLRPPGPDQLRHLREHEVGARRGDRQNCTRGSSTVDQRNSSAQLGGGAPAACDGPSASESELEQRLLQRVDVFGGDGDARCRAPRSGRRTSRRPWPRSAARPRGSRGCGCGRRTRSRRGRGAC